MKNDNKPICSLDFDGCLSTKSVQDFYIQYKDKIHFVVVTRRFTELHKHLWKDNPTNEELWHVVDRLGHPREEVYFCNMEYKYKFLKESTVQIHLDDDPADIHLIGVHTTVYPVYYQNDRNWKRDILKKLNIEE